MGLTKFTDKDSEILNNLSKTKGFLGKEFLTWLWFQSERTEEPLSLDGGDQQYAVKIWVDDRISLESTVTKNHVYSLKGGNPSQSMEASAALWSGKTVKELKLGMDIDALGEFQCVLNAKDLAPRSLKVPAANEPKSPEESLEQRVALTEAFVACLGSLFAMFLGERMKKDWATSGYAAMQSWMRTRVETLPEGSLH